MNFLSKITKINRLNVVGISRKDDQEYFNVLSVKKKGDKIEIDSLSSYLGREELFKNINLKLPMLLVIEGKGILNREVNFENDSDIAWYKNIDHSSICFTSIKTPKSSFMSFCRKNIVEEYKAVFSEYKTAVLDIYLGSFLSVLLYSNIKNETILSGELSLYFEDDFLANFSKKIEGDNRNYQLGKDSISSEILPLYGTLLHFYMQQKEVSKTENDITIAEEIVYKKIFNVFGSLLIVGFFCSLLFSYLMTGYYLSKNTELNLENVYSAQSHEMILDLEKQKEKKNAVLNESGSLTSRFMTFYGHDIVKNIPGDVKLINLSILPLYEAIKQNKKADFEAKRIKISGETSSEYSLNSWIEKLKNVEWGSNFEILSIKKDKKGITHFELKMTLKDV